MKVTKRQSQFPWWTILSLWGYKSRYAPVFYLFGIVLDFRHPDDMDGTL